MVLSLLLWLTYVVGLGFGCNNGQLHRKKPLDDVKLADFNDPRNAIVFVECVHLPPAASRIPRLIYPFLQLIVGAAAPVIHRQEERWLFAKKPSLFQAVVSGSLKHSM